MPGLDQQEPHLGGGGSLAHGDIPLAGSAGPRYTVPAGHHLTAIHCKLTQLERVQLCAGKADVPRASEPSKEPTHLSAEDAFPSPPQIALVWIMGTEGPTAWMLGFPSSGSSQLPGKELPAHIHFRTSGKPDERNVEK